MFYRKRNPVDERISELEKTASYRQVQEYTVSHLAEREKYEVTREQTSSLGIHIQPGTDEWQAYLNDYIHSIASSPTHSHSPLRQNQIFDYQVPTMRVWDYHGFNTTACKQSIETILGDLDTKHPYLLVIIVGKGKHTKRMDGTKPVRMAIQDVCKTMHIPPPVQSVTNWGIVFITNTSYIPLDKNFDYLEKRMNSLWYDETPTQVPAPNVADEDDK
jgi:hypothetical protein